MTNVSNETCERRREKLETDIHKLRNIVTSYILKAQWEHWEFERWIALLQQEVSQLKKDMKGYKTFDELKEIDNEFKQRFASTFNLWEGNKVKSNILKYKKDYDGHHPTQKPVLLLEDLIKTFRN